MAEIRGAHHTSFTVADLDRSVAFFRDVLEFELVYVRDVRDDYFGAIVGLPGCTVRAGMFKIPGAAHHLELFEYVDPRGTPVASRPCDPGSCHLALLVDDLPALYQRIKGCGATFVSEPVPITNGPNKGGFGLYLRDPNGILVELFQPPRRVES